MVLGILKKGYQLIGRGRKRLSTKVHLSISIGGIQIICLYWSQRLDMKIFPKLWELGKWSGIQYIIADKAVYQTVNLKIHYLDRFPH